MSTHPNKRINSIISEGKYTVDASIFRLLVIEATFNVRELEY